MDYNYAIVHQSPGIPLTETGAQPIVYHLEGDRTEYSPRKAQEMEMNPKTNNDSLVTEPLLLRLTDCDSLEEIRVISLRNKELTSCLRMLSLCPNLNIAYIQGNRIHLQDMMYLQAFKNLKKLDLSNNQITSLPSGQVFQHLTSLRFLYLHNNKISKWHDIASLSSLPGILHITLFSNTVCQIPGYRHFLVNSVRSLLALDHFVITDEERIEDASFGYRFRALNDFMKLHVPDYAREKSAEQHLFNVEVDIYRLRRIFERNSPTIMIQAVYRGWRLRNRVRLQMAQKVQKVVKIQKVARGFLTRLRFKKELMDMLQMTGQQYLMMSNQQIRQRSAGFVIKKFVLKKYRERKREQLEIKSAIIIQRHVRGRQARFKSYWEYLGLEEQPFIYILKEQKPLFIKFLKELSPTFEQQFGMNLEKLSSKIHDTNKYDTLRVAEPDIFEYKWQPIVQFVMPTSLSRLRENKHREKHCFQKPHFTLFDMYFKPDFPTNLKSWNTLKVRNCKVYKQRVLDLITQRAKRLQPKNQFVFQDQYRDFFVFQPENNQLLQMVLRYILHYNMQANKLGEQFFLVFFEKVLQKVAAASLIQRNWRSYVFRRRFNPLPNMYPIQELMEKRAAQCLQRWWSDIRLRRRIEGLEKIKKFCEKIQTPQLYLEQSIYNNLKKITKMIQTQIRYEEQTLDFDFNQMTNQVCLSVSESHKFVTRYHSQAIPYWFGIPFRNLEFSQTPFYNDLQALFHLNEADAIVLPIDYVVNHKNKALDIDRELCFLQCTFSSLEEARRRAYIIATLTYDVHQRVFANLATADMLEDPFQLQRIVKLRKRFEIDPEPSPFGPSNHTLEERLVKDYFIDQLRQPHSGVLLSEKDIRVTRSAHMANLIFKNIKVDGKKEVTISCADAYETKLVDMELERIMNGGKKNVLSHFQTKKLHQEAFNLLKQRRNQILQESIQEFRSIKDQQKMLLSMAQEQEVVERREEVNKIREITKIINTEQKYELDKNLQVFLALNREEKHLRKELVEKQHEVDYKEKYLKKMQVAQQHKRLQEKKAEETSFVQGFMHAKNLIEKQMKIGRKIKDNKIIRQEKRDIVTKIREERDNDTSRDKVQVRSTLFDHQINSENGQSAIQRQSKSLLQYNNRRKHKESYLSAQDHTNETWDTSHRKLIMTTMAGEDSTILKTRSFGLKPQSQVHQSRNMPKSFNKSYILPMLNDQSMIGRNDSINNQNHTTNKTFISYITQSGKQVPSNYDGRTNRGIEEIYSYVHDDSVKQLQNWKRDSTRPIFAEENFPLTRNQNQHQYNSNKQPHQPTYHLTLDMHNGLTGKNSGLNVDLNNSNSTFSINRTQTDLNHADNNNARSSERRSLLARISTSQLLH